jgi:hypothetical protein
VIARRKRNFLIALAGFAGLSVAVLFVAGYMLAKRSEPYIRQQTIQYLEKRFDSDVELASLQVHLPKMSVFEMIARRARGAVARVEAEGISMRHKANPDLPPMFRMKQVSFEVDLGTLFDTPKTIRSVVVDGMDITIPPKGRRPTFGSGADEEQEDRDSPSQETGVIIEEVIVSDSSLTILPRDAKKIPLRFDLHRVRLESAGKDVAMTYDATLTNAKPPGDIQSKGTFGPWVAGEPGDTPLAGEYEFKNANLGVFSGIAGTLDSTGRFKGTLSSIEVEGEASVPNFTLKRSDNPVPLKTRFNVLVDGTNGDSILKPVVGTLGSTTFTTSGAVIKRDTDRHRSISLDVVMPNGNLRDVLRLAMKGTPFMEGRIHLKTRIDIPPLSGKVREKLQLDGQFELTDARFLRSKIQSHIDTLSRRGQGKPKDEEIDQVVSGMAGSFKLVNEVITFRSLSFAVPGAGVDLAGTYDLDNDALDFHGALKLQAKVSQTMTGWKRWVLKPVDPFFSKNGAGTFLRIQVDGSSKEPRFGREKHKQDEHLSGVSQ